MKESASGAPLLVLPKIVAILDAFSLDEPSLPLSRIQERTGLPVSTTQRLVANLVEQELLVRSGAEFRLGPRLALWGALARQASSTVDLLLPELERLRDATGEAACFFERSLDYRVCSALAETPHELRIQTRVGALYPLTAGSAGRVLLAWAPDAERAASSEIRRTRADGYAITSGEREVGASGLSAPVFGAQGALVGALTIQGPAVRLDSVRCRELVPTLRAAAERCTRLLGGASAA